MGCSSSVCGAVHGSVWQFMGLWGQLIGLWSAVYGSGGQFMGLWGAVHGSMGDSSWVCGDSAIIVFIMGMLSHYLSNIIIVLTGNWNSQPEAEDVSFFCHMVSVNTDLYFINVIFVYVCTPHTPYL